MKAKSVKVYVRNSCVGQLQPLEEKEMKPDGSKTLSDLRFELSQLAAVTTLSLKKLERLKKEIVERETLPDEVKSAYPIGYDPAGQWIVIWNCADKWEVITMTGHLVNNWHRTGCQFTTRSQAVHAAAGRNAKPDLVQALHEFNNSGRTDFYQIVQATGRLDLVSLSLPWSVVKEIGKERIELAIQWGI